MYDLVRPPTDNLYKFIAISGLVLFVGANAFMATRVADQASAVRDAVADSRRAGLELDVKQERFDELTTGSEVLSDAEIAEMRSLVQEIQRVTLEMDIRLVEVEAREAALKWYGIVAGVLSGLGLMVTFWGFVQWYNRVQFYEDRRLRDMAGGDNPGDKRDDHEPAQASEGTPKAQQPRDGPS